MVYEEFLKTEQRGIGKCFCCDKENVPLYDSGDARYHCLCCEECARMDLKYLEYLESEKKKVTAKKLNKEAKEYLENTNGRDV